VFVTNSRPDTCTIAAMGASDVSLATGEGTLSGTYAVLVQLDNALDSPELPLQTGAFHGSITFRPPLGFATAFLVVNGTVQDAQACAESPRTDCIRFTATFRQPVAMSARGRHVKPRRGQRAFYLVDDERVSVQPDERAVGWPTVRFEINF
jgi:hypothetical protein